MWDSILASFEALDLLSVFLAIGIGYFLGSIPCGLIITKLAVKLDIRGVGSGNIGTTNVLRSGHPILAAITLICDMAKGFVPTFYFFLIPIYELSTLAGGAAVMGHIFPIWLRYRGGKGVATYMGCLFGYNWKLGTVFVTSWVLVALFTRYASLASILSCVILMIVCIFLAVWQVIVFVFVFGTLIVAMHHENIKRLWEGKEFRIGEKRENASE